MTLHLNEEISRLLNPYMLVLREEENGEGTPEDYSLQMLQVGHFERLKSPDQIHLFPLLTSNTQSLQSDTCSN